MDGESPHVDAGGETEGMDDRRASRNETGSKSKDPKDKSRSNSLGSTSKSFHGPRGSDGHSSISGSVGVNAASDKRLSNANNVSTDEREEIIQGTGLSKSAETGKEGDADTTHRERKLSSIRSGGSIRNSASKSIEKGTRGQRLSSIGSRSSGKVDRRKSSAKGVNESNSRIKHRKDEHKKSLEANLLHKSPGTSIFPDTEKVAAISFAASEQTWSQRDEPDGDEDDGTMETGLYAHDHTFDKLQEIYHYTITGLEAAQAMGVNLEPVKSQFVKLWDGIYRSHQNVMRLQTKDHEISVNLAATMAKTRTMIKIAEEDPETRARLVSKLEAAWGFARTGEAEERNNEFKLSELKEDLFMLNRSINAASKAEGQVTVVELTKLKSQFEAQKSYQAAESAKLHSDIQIIFERRQELGELRVGLEDRLRILTEEEKMCKDGISRERQRKERLTKAIRHTIHKCEQRAHDVEHLVGDLANSDRKLADIDRFVREQKIINEDAMHELEIASNKYSKLKQDHETQARLCERLTNDLYKRQGDLKEKEEEVLAAKSMISRMSRQRTLNQKKVTEFKLVLAALEEEREVLKHNLILLEKELEGEQRKVEKNRKDVEEMDRERGIINRTLQRAVAVATAHTNQRVTHELAIRNLQTDIAGYEREIHLQESVIAHLEKDRDTYTHEGMKLAHQVVVRLEEARKLEKTIYEFQRKLGVFESQLRKQQHVYETALYERTLAQRQLRDAMTDAIENNVKLIHMGHEIMALKFQVAEKDTIIHIEASRYERVLRETAFYAGEGKRIKNMAYDMIRMVEALAAERFLLKKTVAAIEGEMGKQLYYTSKAESRKQTFSRKLMIKESELKEIWEKWRVLHSKIRIGAYHFRNLVGETRQLRLQIFEIKKENVGTSYGTTRVRKLQREIVLLENIIAKETCMCNSIRDSSKHPINVHRWRVLECKNPEAFDMVFKSNLLTKRVVDRNALITQHERELVYKQEIYCQIREALAKAPGLEMPENVTYYEHLLSSKRKQFKKLEAELEKSRNYTDYYADELTLVTEAVNALREKYFSKQRSLGKSFTKDYKSDEESNNNTNAITTFGCKEGGGTSGFKNIRAAVSLKSNFKELPPMPKIGQIRGGIRMN